jgi:hypothetical protein
VATRLDQSPVGEYDKGTVEGNTGINGVGFIKEGPTSRIY